MSEQLYSSSEFHTSSQKENVPEDGRLLRVEQEIERNTFSIFLDAKEYALPTDISIDTRVVDGRNDEDRQSRAGKTYLVIGGVGEDAGVMMPFVRDLALQGHQVVTLSLPSSGKSSDAGKQWRVDGQGKDKADFSDYSALIDGVLGTLRKQSQQLGIVSPMDKISVVGHSLGGSVVADYASRHTPEHIADVVLVAPGGYTHEYTLPTPVRVAPRLLMKFIGAVFSDRVPKNIKNVFETVKNPDVFKGIWQNFLQTGNFANLLHSEKLEHEAGVPLRVMQRFWEGYVLSQSLLQGHLKKIVETHIPITIIASEQDALLPVSDFQSLQKEVGDDEETFTLTTVPDVGHYGILDNSADFAKKVSSANQPLS